MDPLRKEVDALGGYLPELEQRRLSDHYANDVYEAIWDWRRLGNWAIEGNTRVNFPQRAREELKLLDTLRNQLSERAQQEQAKYGPALETGETILRVLEVIQPSKAGHLGVLKIIHELFAFLESDYGFSVVREEPIGIRFSSGDVFLELEWAKNPSCSCSFGAESNIKHCFWIDDLLFAYGDKRYRNLPDELELDTESDVESWFKFLAEVFKQYGNSVLRNEAGIFETLARSQAERDAEYVQEMESRHGKSGSA